MCSEEYRPLTADLQEDQFGKPVQHSDLPASRASRERKNDASFRRYFLSCTWTIVAWYQLLPKFSDKPGHSVLAALNQSSLPGVPSAFQEAIDSGHVRESMRVGTCSLWTNDSRTTLRVLANRPGLPVFGGGSLWQAFPLWPVAAEGGTGTHQPLRMPRGCQ